MWGDSGGKRREEDTIRVATIGSRRRVHRRGHKKARETARKAD
jgi:hypothetical protein